LPLKGEDTFEEKKTGNSNLFYMEEKVPIYFTYLRNSGNTKRR
jgi:hypothetical protein